MRGNMGAMGFAILGFAAFALLVIRVMPHVAELEQRIAVLEALEGISNEEND